MTANAYARGEIAGRMRWLFKPSIARNGCVKDAIRKAKDLFERAGVWGVKGGWHRAKELINARAKPDVEEMDLIRSLTPDYPHSPVKAELHVKADEVVRDHVAEDRLAAIEAGLDSLAQAIEAYRAGLAR